jgi:hypothetical protein
LVLGPSGILTEFRESGLARATSANAITMTTKRFFILNAIYWVGFAQQHQQL